MSKLADYGITLLLVAARDVEGSVQTARALAEATDLPLPTVSKILKALARGGLLLSHRGNRGGYSLTRPAAAISVVDIIRAIDGNPALTQCADDAEGRCEREEFCPTRGSWTVINERVLRALSNLSLADIAAPRPPPLVTLGARLPRRQPPMHRKVP